MSLFRQEDRQPFGSGFFYNSGGSKHQKAKVARVTLPPLVLGTFKLWLCVLTTIADTETELLTGIEINTLE